MDIAIAVILLLCVSIFREPLLAHSLLDMQINANECTSRFSPPVNAYVMNMPKTDFHRLLNWNHKICACQSHLKPITLSHPTENISSPPLWFILKRKTWLFVDQKAICQEKLSLSCLWLFLGGDQKLGKAICCSHDPQCQNRWRADRGELQGMKIFLVYIGTYRGLDDLICILKVYIFIM